MSFEPKKPSAETALKCAKLQMTINAISTLHRQLTYNYTTDYVVLEENKIVIKLPVDIYNGEKDPLFKKGERFLRVANKISEMCDDVGYKIQDIDKLNSFKTFSQANVPNKKI